MTMARIKLEMPAHYLTVQKVRVRITDINYGNHVGNDAFVGILHDARMQWLSTHGFTELDVQGTGLIMGDLAVEFKNESFYGDEVEVAIGVNNIGRVNFDLYYRLTTFRNGEVILLANAKTGMICYDYNHKKIAPVPAVLLILLSTR
jgi:acyl-CoA thioester hydrolase